MTVWETKTDRNKYKSKANKDKKNILNKLERFFKGQKTS